MSTHYAPIDILARDATVNELLMPFLACVKQVGGATDAFVNRPGEVFVEAGANTVRLNAPELTLDWALSLATAVATYSEQVIGTTRPILSAMLPAGERLQVVLPPACELGTVSLSLRIPSATIKPLQDFERDGAFSRYTWARPVDYDKHKRALTTNDRQLCEALNTNQLARFITLAVQQKKNIAFIGDTGTGKTTLMKSVCQLIPAHERLITIEDVRELFLPQHPNRVHLLYSKAGQGVAEVTPAELIASNMRMKPQRVLLAELRGSEAFDFLRLLTAGHRGSITSFHAESCAFAYDRLCFMCHEHADAHSYNEATLKRLIELTLDVILHLTAEVTRAAEGSGNGNMQVTRYIDEVMFDPLRQMNMRYGNADLIRAGKPATELRVLP